MNGLMTRFLAGEGGEGKHGMSTPTSILPHQREGQGGGGVKYVTEFMNSYTKGMRVSNPVAFLSRDKRKVDDYCFNKIINLHKEGTWTGSNIC